MLRLSSLVIFAAFLACGLAQSTTTDEPTTTEMNETTTEMNETTTTPEVPVTTEPPTQPVQMPANYSYAESNKVCLRVVGNMTWNVIFENGTETGNVTFNLDDLVQVEQDNCSCSSSATQKFGIYFQIFDAEVDAQFITITFENASNAWNASEVTYTFTTDSYPDLDVSNPGWYNFVATSNLFQSNVDLGDSYSCGNAKLTFNSSAIEYKLNATLTVENLQVQAFYTDKTPQYGFGAAQDCASGKGNKIVPIAVGAALAGLVIVVLIAYLIGRLKSRKQNSYEALS